MKYFLLAFLFVSEVLGASTKVLPRGIAVPAGTVLVGASTGVGTTTPQGTSGQFLQSAGTSTPVWKNIQGGLKNYITAGDAESGTTGSATYSDSAGVLPVDGVGGTPSITWTTTSTTPLELANSFIFTKDAVNRQGQGASYAFTIDREDQAKVMNIKFSYQVNSGTFVAGTQTTPSDVTVWIYDVTNGVIIPPSSSNLLSNSSTIADPFSATFQTASNSTSYRLIFHVGTTSASAYSLKIDSIKVNPSVYPSGTVISDWFTYTPVWTSAGSPSIGNGTLLGRWRKVGDSIEVWVDLTFGTTTSGAGANWVFSLPTGIFLDSTKAPFGAPAAGSAVLLDSGTAYSGAVPIIVGSGFRVTPATASGSQVGVTVPFTWATGDNLNFTATAPVLGWSSSVQMSEASGVRDVYAAIFGDPASATANNPILFPTVGKDTMNAYNPATGRYTCPETGFYKVYGTTRTGSTGFTLYLWRSGSTTNVEMNSWAGADANTKVIMATSNCRQGEYLDIRPNNTADMQQSAIYFEKLSSPQTMAASESLNLRYTNTAGTAIGTSYADFPFATMLKDTHGNFNGTTFTPYIPGFYVFCAHVVASVNLTTSQSISLKAVVNGSDYAYDQSPGVGAANFHNLRVCDGVQLLAGGTLKFQAISNVATSAVTTPGANYIYIFRQGN